MSNNNNTQVTIAKDYNTNNMIFSEPIAGSIPDSKPKIEFQRVNISTKNEDGSIGELIIPTARLFCFGVSENTNQETGAVNGYTFPLCMWSRDGATEEEKSWTDTMSNIVTKCIDHIVDNKEELELYDLDRADLTKSKGGLDPFYWKKEKYTNPKGKIELRVVPGTGPTLYTKLLFSKKSGKFISQFFDVSGNELNALDIMGSHCYSTSAIKIESIFIGAKVSLQIKLYESVVEPLQQGMKRLLISRPVSQSKVIEHKSNVSSVPLAHTDTDTDKDDTGSLVDDEEVREEVPEEEKVSETKAVRKVKKVGKKTDV
jgi:hypothetical protein